MTTRTPAQVAQLIQFYNDCLPRVEAFGLYNLPGTHYKFFIEGKKLAKAQAQAEAAAKRAQSRSISWTAEEYDVLASAYVEHTGDRPSILSEFRKFSERHTDSAIDMMAQICLQVDSTIKTATGLNHPAQGLLDALNAIEPGRFKVTR